MAKKAQPASSGHLKVRTGLFDHLKLGWMDDQMYTAYNILLEECNWATGIWHGSGDKLSASVGGQWSKSTANRVLERLAKGKYITSRYIRGRQGNYDVAINNYEPTTGENAGKRIRRTATIDYRTVESEITSDPCVDQPCVMRDSPVSQARITGESSVDHPCAVRGSRVRRIQELTQELDFKNSSSTVSESVSELTDDGSSDSERDDEILDFLDQVHGTLWPFSGPEKYDAAYKYAVKAFAVRRDGAWLLRCLHWSQTHVHWKKCVFDLRTFAKALSSTSDRNLVDQFLAHELKHSKEGVLV